MKINSRIFISIFMVLITTGSKCSCSSDKWKLLWRSIDSISFKSNAGVGEFPWHVFITGGPEGKSCEGAILDKRHIITSARCAATINDNHDVLVGQRDRGSTIDEQIHYTIQDSIPFPSSNPRDDIAIIRLSSQIQFRHSYGDVGAIQPVELPTKGRGVKEGEILDTSSFRILNPFEAYDMELQKATLIVEKKCRNNDNYFCHRGYPNFYSDFQGLKGSGVVRQRDSGVFELVGIVSDINPDEIEHGIRRSIRVDPYLPWIKLTIKNGHSTKNP